jgi:DNA-directed RNA polymerase-5 subunit 1
MRLPPDSKALRHRSLPHPDLQRYEATLQIPETIFLPMRALLDPYILARNSPSRYDQVVQRLSLTMKMVAKGILKDHLVLVADSMMSTGIKKRFNNAGYKATFRPLKVQVPLTESTLFTPMKCMRRLQRDAILIHWDVWSHHVRGASMQYLALSHLLIFCNENQLKSNKEYGDSLYAVLTLVRTDQEKARYTFLEDVDYLIGDNAMDDICLLPELDRTLGMPTFEHSSEHQNF